MAPKKIPTREVPRNEYGGRLKNALERLAVMEEVLAGGHEDPALVLAVQAVIAASDALAIYHLGERSAAGDHQDAISVFSRLPSLPQIDQARTHLSRVLDHKSEVEYSGRALRKKDVESIVDHARRFVAYARKRLPAPSK
jgi:hypothetical protein